MASVGQEELLSDDAVRPGREHSTKISRKMRIASVVSGDEEAPALGILCRSLSLCLGAAAE